VTWARGRGGGECPQIFILLKKRFFFGYWVEERQIKQNWDESRGKCCVYIKDSFKKIFLLFLT
jgi:hypothetical protein